jgi:1-acyl-sn-glycerol-3-phosphate acyltransferase
LSQSSPRAPEPAGLLKRNFIRYTVRLLSGLYLRVRREGWENIPAAPPYLLCFNHPNWVDPFLIVAHWPKSQPFFIFGPKEEDMKVGWRNRVIAWGHLAVPFKPSRSDLIETTKKAMAVVNAGYALGIAGEGRLSDREGEVAPLQDGAAFFALRAKMPIVPVGISGTRWLCFGKRVTIRVGPVIDLTGRRPDRAGVLSLTEELTDKLNALIAGAQDGPRPGPFGRWLTDVFNERPWLNEKPAAPPG